MIRNAFSDIQAARKAREEAEHQRVLDTANAQREIINEITRWTGYYRAMVVGVLQDLRQALYPSDHVVTNRPVKITFLPNGQYTLEPVWEIGVMTRTYGVDKWEWQVRVTLQLDFEGYPVGFLCDRCGSVRRRGGPLIRMLLSELSPRYAAAEAALITPQEALLTRESLIGALHRLHPVA